MYFASLVFEVLLAVIFLSLQTRACLIYFHFQSEVWLVCYCKAQQWHIRVQALQGPEMLSWDLQPAGAHLVAVSCQSEKGYRWRCSHGINRFATSLISPYSFPLVIIANEHSDNRNPLFGRMWECMRGCVGAKRENRLLLRNRTKQKCHRFACRALVGVDALECIRLYHAVPI